MRYSLSLVLLMVMIATGSLQPGCGSQSREVEQASATKDIRAKLTVAQQKQKDKAIAAKDKLFATLMSELMQSLSKNGAANSIQVCKERAPEIAKEVCEESGVRIGRTSFQLRNSSNVAPRWAADLVKNKVEKPVEVALPNDELGVLLPIRLQSTCTICHGSDEQISPDVKSAIVSSYPEDAATGFQDGDIRGYFWIEVPPEQ